MAQCLACDALIDIDEFDVDQGDQFSCSECGSNLEVASLSPIELELVSEDNGDGDKDDRTSLDPDDKHDEHDEDNDE